MIFTLSYSSSSIHNSAMKVYRVQTGRLVIRCWEPKDAPLLKEAVDCSIDHLLPWLPWAKHEPQSVEEKTELLRGFRGRYDLDQDYVLAIFDRDETQVLGGTGFHPRHGRNEQELGYWVRADRAGQGIVTEAITALLWVGFRIEGFSRLEIRCEPANRASAAIPRKLGFTHEGTLRGKNLAGTDQPRDTMVWGLLQDEYRGMPEGIAPPEAFDVTGTKIEIG